VSNKPKPESMVYEVPEAGALLGLGRGAAYRAAANGDLPTIKIGKLIRVPRAALHRLLESAQPSAPTDR